MMNVYAALDALIPEPAEACRRIDAWIASEKKQRAVERELRAEITLQAAISAGLVPDLLEWSRQMHAEPL